MNKKRIIVIFGILYYVGGLGAGIICLRQSQVEKSEPKSTQIVQQQENITQATENVESESNAVEESEMVETTQEQPEENLKPEETTEQKQPEENGTEQEEQKKYLAVVINVGKKRLRIRNQPSVEGEIIGTMVLNQKAKVIEVGEEWHLIEVNDIEGYVSSRHIELVEIPNDGTS